MDFKSPMSSASMSSCSRGPFTGTRSRLEIEFGEIEDFHPKCIDFGPLSETSSETLSNFSHFRQRRPTKFPTKGFL